MWNEILNQTYATLIFRKLGNRWSVPGHRLTLLRSTQNLRYLDQSSQVQYTQDAPITHSMMALDTSMLFRVKRDLPQNVIIIMIFIQCCRDRSPRLQVL